MTEIKEVVSYTPRANNLGWKVPTLPSSDDKVVWSMMEIMLRNFLKRFDGYLFALDLEIGNTEEEIETQKELHGRKLDIVYSLIERMPRFICKFEIMLITISMNGPIIYGN